VLEFLGYAVVKGDMLNVFNYLETERKRDEYYGFWAVRVHDHKMVETLTRGVEMV